MTEAGARSPEHDLVCLHSNFVSNNMIDDHSFTTVLKSILDLQRHCKAFHFHSQLSLDLPTSWSCFYPSCVASVLLLPSGEWSQSLPDADCCELGGPAIYPQLQQCHRPFHPTTSALWRSFEARLSYMTLSLSCKIFSIKCLIRAFLNALIMSC